MESGVEPIKLRGVLEVVDAAADLLRRRTRDVAILASVAAVPVLIIAVIAGIGSSDEFSGDALAFLFADQNDIDVSFLLLTVSVRSVCFAFVTFAMCRIIVGEVLGEVVSPRAALAAAARKAPTLIVLWLFVHVAELLGVLALGVGFIIAMCALMVTVPALASEPGLGPVTAFQRSWHLSNGAKGRIFGVLLVLLIIATLLSAVLVLAPLSVLGLVVDGTALWVLAIGLQVVADVVVQGIVSAATVYTYLDLRVRREGLDIDMRLTRLR